MYRSYKFLRNTNVSIMFNLSDQLIFFLNGHLCVKGRDLPNLDENEWLQLHFCRLFFQEKNLNPHNKKKLLVWYTISPISINIFQNIFKIVRHKKTLLRICIYKYIKVSMSAFKSLFER